MKGGERKVAILVVNGGRDLDHGSWLSLCIGKILQHTDESHYHLFVWNNNVEDVALEKHVRFLPGVTLVRAPSGIKLSHVHADPLQRLYELARAQGYDVVVTMDSDAHPVKDGWLRTLVDELDSGCVLAGAWRDELHEAIEPYVHASCLATSMAVVEQYGLRFDFIPKNTDNLIHDTCSEFTRTLVSKGLKISTWKRSNVNAFHRLIGGVYGDYIYHHGAGSRKRISFWDEPREPALMERNGMTGQVSAAMLFQQYDQYMSWLRGAPTTEAFALSMSTLRDEGPTAFPGLMPPPEPSGEPKSGLDAVRKLVRAGSKRVRSASDGRRAVKRRKPWPSMVRPFGREDFYSRNRNYESRPPDFIGVGVPKAGTSWWHDNLIAHPEIYPNALHNPRNPLSTKESHYFTHFVNRNLSPGDIQTYYEAFARPNGYISGEWSVLYMSQPSCLQMIQQVAPDAKLMVMLRNPIDRYLSHMDHIVRNRGRMYRVEDDVLQVFKTFSATTEAALHSRYTKGLRQIRNDFSADKVLVLQYESCSVDAMSNLRRTYDFLGVDPGFSPSTLEAKVNVQQHVLPPADPEVRRRLMEYFREDATEAAALFPGSIDLDLWPEFK